jgi:hypothetical protein
MSELHTSFDPKGSLKKKNCDLVGGATEYWGMQNIIIDTCHIAPYLPKFQGGPIIFGLRYTSL